VRVVIAANIWHWWIGVVLSLVGLLAVLGVVFGYLKNVTAKQYPGRHQHED
jgi:hypothetical protein